MRPKLAAALLGSLAAALGCGPRGLLTSSPIVGHARLGDLELASAEPDRGPEETEPPARTHAPAAASVVLPPALTTPAAALHVDAAVLIDGAPAAPGASEPGSIVISRLPAPHRTVPVAPGEPAAPLTVAGARALVGRRDPRAPFELALAVATALTRAPAPRATDGPALVAWAEASGTWAALPAASLEPGDLVVLDRAVDDAPASLVAVVLATDLRGVTELLYLGRGVIRRGFLDPARSALARDADGRVVNSFVRHGAAYPPAGTRYLAGELAIGRVRPPR